MSGWIGREARAPMSVQYSGAPVTIDPQPPIAGSRHELVVFDADGAEVDRRQISSSGEQIVWNGTTSTGDPVSVGAGVPGVSRPLLTVCEAN